jgi:hypothetical protein
MTTPAISRGPCANGIDPRTAYPMNDTTIPVVISVAAGLVWSAVTNVPARPPNASAVPLWEHGHRITGARRREEAPART